MARQLEIAMICKYIYIGIETSDMGVESRNRTVTTSLTVATITTSTTTGTILKAF